MKKTPWFSNNTPPARVGLYEIRWQSNEPPSPNLRLFNGYKWVWQRDGIESMFKHIAGAQWRGLTTKDGK